MQHCGHRHTNDTTLMESVVFLSISIGIFTTHWTSSRAYAKTHVGEGQLGRTRVGCSRPLRACVCLRASARYRRAPADSISSRFLASTTKRAVQGRVFRERESRHSCILEHSSVLRSPVPTHQVRSNARSPLYYMHAFVCTVRGGAAGPISRSCAFPRARRVFALWCDDESMVATCVCVCE